MHENVGPLRELALAIAEPFTATLLIAPDNALRVIHPTVGAGMNRQGLLVVDHF